MLCACGCRVEAGLSKVRPKKPLRFIHGHNGRLKHPGYREDPVTGCWIWLGRIRPDGYAGGICHQDRRVAAHVAYFLKNGGAIPSGHQLDHFVCDNRACVNPAHVRPVLPKMNRRRGCDVILSMESARLIRRCLARGVKGRDLAAEFHVSKQTICNIKAGRIWREAEG